MSTYIAARTRHRLFYGWFIAAVGLLANYVGVAATLYALTVLIKPMAVDLGWSRALIVGASTLAGVMGGLVSPWVGRVVDRHGARLTMVVGALVGGALLVAVSRVNAPWQFYLLFGLGLGLIQPGLHGVAAATAVANWFVRKRGRATAVASLGVGLGALTVPILIQFVISRSGDWRTGWLVLGIMMWVLMVPSAALLMRRRPEDMGMRPDGDAEPARNMPSAAAMPREEVNWTARAALRTRAFWLILGSFICSGLAFGGVLLHAIASFSDKGLSPGVAAGTMTSLAIASVSSRLLWGFVAERFPVRVCVAAVAFGSGLGILFINLANNVPTAYAAMAFFGLPAGGLVQLQMQVWPDYFGRMAAGAIRGYASMFMVASNAGGPLFAAWINDVTHSYFIAFLVFTIALAVSGLLILLATPPELPGRGPEGIEVELKG